MKLADKYPQHSMATREVLRWLDRDQPATATGDQAQLAELVDALAFAVLETCPDGPELQAGLRKLLEAKDCFMRAALW